MNWTKPDWPVAANIYAATTFRTGGVSEGVYDSFNLALHVNDRADDVLKNRQILTQKLSLPSEPIWMQQVHGDRVIKADQYTCIEEADASYTDKPNTVCVVLTADCLPVLLASTDGRQVAAIHAGWRGLCSGIIGQTIKRLGTTDVIAWLGPAIGSGCFEVEQEVVDTFVNKSEKFSEAFTSTGHAKYLADIYRLATIDLASMGISRVYGGQFCTVTEKERFYSYRRDGETGRMATLIWRD
jgi:YfiH family protein